jgi:hypothetical protein
MSERLAGSTVHVPACATCVAAGDVLRSVIVISMHLISFFGIDDRIRTGFFRKVFNATLIGGASPGGI